MKYIWLDDSPILQQVDNDFTSAAILFHPFVQMPENWTETKKSHPFEHIYPTDEEQLALGHPIQWAKMMQMTGLTSYKDIAISLMTSISALTSRFANEEFAKRLNDSLDKDVYFPPEDTMSIFMLETIITLFQNMGASTLHYFDPIYDRTGTLNVADVSAIQLANIAEREVLITDENHELAFLSVFDSFTTIMLYKHDNIATLAQPHFEHLICDHETTRHWYLQNYIE